VSCCSEGEQLLRGSKDMARIPMRGRVPVEGWVMAAVLTIMSIVSSGFGGPDASDVLGLSPLFGGAQNADLLALAHSVRG
jgi:hypothetical protein